MEAGAPSEYAEALQRIEAAQESDVVEQALTAARQRLDMDAAYVTTIDSENQTVEAMVGTTNAEPLVPGAVIPVEQTFCMRMLGGEIPNVVPDTRAEPALRDLAATHYIGAYVGVPVTLSDGRVHGTLCCASNDPRDGLGEAELEFMRVLASIVAARVDQAQGDLARLTALLNASRAPG